MNRLIKKIECQCCGRIFEICRKCYKGHVYCSKKCRRAGYIERHREAQRRYQKTRKGKKTRNNAANRRRYGGKNYVGVLRKMIKTCLALINLNAYKEKESKEQGKCSICGKVGVIVDEFPKRSYGKKTILEEKGSMACF